MALFYEGRDFKRKLKARIDRQIDFDWGLGAPEKGLPADYFSVRWLGELRAPSPGKYTLSITVDDGLRLWLDDDLLIDHMDTVPGSLFRVVVYLTDQPHTFRLDYNELHSPAKVSMRWTRDGSLAEETLSAHAFFHDEDLERQLSK